MRTKYIRIQTRYCGKTGKPVGIFGACWHLKRAERLSNEEYDIVSTNYPGNIIYEDDYQVAVV